MSTLFVQGYGQMYTARYRQTGLADAPAPPAPAAPAAPGGLAVQYTGSAMVLTWTDNSSNEGHFAIERCEGAGCSVFSPVGTAAADAPTWTDFGVVAGRSYSYRVRSWAGSGGYSNYSNVATGTAGTLPPPVAAPTAPTNLSASPLSLRRIQLRWANNSSTQTGIAIERCAAPCTNFSEIARVAGNATSFTNSGLASRTSYSYRVRAYNATGFSPYSASVTARTTR
jgi:hypothetical protein